MVQLPLYKDNLFIHLHIPHSNMTKIIILVKDISLNSNGTFNLDVKIVVNDKTIATLNTNNLEDLRTGLKEWVTLVYSKDLDNEIYTKYNLIEAILRNNIHHVGIHELPELLELLIQQL